MCQWWNTAVIISQELPEVAFNYVIVGILGIWFEIFIWNFL